MEKEGGQEFRSLKVQGKLIALKKENHVKQYILCPVLGEYWQLKSDQSPIAIDTKICLYFISMYCTLSMIMSWHTVVQFEHYFMSPLAGDSNPIIETRPLSHS